MSKQEIKDRLLKILVNDFGLYESEIKDEHTLEDLHIDSLEKIELVMVLETEFDIENINDEDVQMNITIEGIVQLIYNIKN